MKYNIPKELIDEYLDIILSLSRWDPLKNLNLYSYLDRKREEIHNKIMLIAKVDRSDKDFVFWLAEYVETILEITKAA